MKRTDFILEQPKQENPYLAGIRAYKFYNTKQWRKLRAAHLMTNPICQECHNAVATEVHHITPILTAFSEAEQRKLAFDPTNLMSVCETCHKEIHKRLKRY